ncbi:branched-chain amino acid ABC transporter permease [Microtetraspora sp. AC03309]|uniref:branched-chain amino acid ABC transporter permease n=1 Tax=Microtetraspora sp. AC03309 TaxID=2779376 RepID=UPI001E3177D1|nr:branched-chain amino acid ABC transporter permease [Microtetraspora sp. AC03309]MCC5579547.1 branched-chain amino acid ABC transporter permease [Microtetraspora sp. AC03309]
MNLLLQVVFAGLSVGAVYALVAVGFGVVANGTGAVNFAQGEYVMVGGVVAGVVHEVWHPPLPVSVLCAVAAGVVAGLVTEFAVSRFSGARSAEIITIATIGLAVALKAAVLLLTDRKTYGLPHFLGERPLRVGGAVADTQTLWNLAVVFVVAVGLSLFFRRTRQGTILRAAADDPEVVTSLGVPFHSVARWVFVIAAVLGALGGAGLAPLSVMSYESGTLLGLKGFAAAMLGGLGNLYGAVIGGLVIGLVEAAVAGYGSAAYGDAVAFVILLIILFTRPTGLFSQRKVVRV